MGATIRSALILALAASLAQAQSQLSLPKQGQLQDLVGQSDAEATDAVDDYVNAQIQKRRIPGLSLAIFENGKVIKAKGYGVVEQGTERLVTPSTLFQAASISKPVTAVGALQLVERGQLSLDGDVNDKLRSWKVPENQFTKQEKVTLRRLLSHSAGLTVHGFPGYAVDEPKPSLVLILDGVKPVNTAPVRVDILPGSKMRYSGGGFCVIQQLLIDVTGKSFPLYMQESVLTPLGMSASTFEQPIPLERARETAGGTYADGKKVEGRWRIYPEMAPAGLWTTPSDLARFAIGIQRALAGQPDAILSREMARQFVTREKGEYGLGVELEDKGAHLRFRHSGRNKGFESVLEAYAETGQGAAIMFNANEYSGLRWRILKVIAKEHHWPGYRRLMTKSRPRVVRVDARTLGSYEGYYYDFDETVVTVCVSEGKLILKVGKIFLDELLPETIVNYFMPDLEAEVTFEKDAQGVVSGFTQKWWDQRVQKLARIGPLVCASEPQTGLDTDAARQIESAVRACAKGGGALETMPGISPGARKHFASGRAELARLKSVSIVGSLDVSNHHIVRHGGNVSRVLYCKFRLDKAHKNMLVYLTAENLLTDFAVIED